MNQCLIQSHFVPYGAGNSCGFTLIELAVILTIFGILSALGVPSILEIMPRIRLNNAAQRIVSDIQFARMRSIATGKEYRLNFDVSTESYQIEEGNRSSGSTWPGAAVDLVRDFNDSSNLYHHKGIDIYSVSQNPVFNPKGFSLTNSNITIKLQDNKGNKKQVTLNIAGKADISEGW
ncbi:MAG: GspH/FimT family pseudopilin [bacterium]